jgi:endoglucanase
MTNTLISIITNQNYHKLPAMPMQRSYGWKSRYVAEYSAIGEAPEEICESLDAHYFNSRGYFQTFWSYHCPLLNRDLGLFYRLMYASRCFQNFASGALPASRIVSRT